ncbi:GNAT family N-acetyltransferase [Desulfurivibrio alkaliphilus]|uniref:GNAT family N-acetyltransferase n=1 Tax=Desulfurivibrio alkaliphilus TaxID=427923 RepID=UPI0012FEE8AE|nr:GNAT family N-acetyltransferase [Desulfurivibrio alkaliphilus]
MASPYFRPEFTQAVAEVREDLFVGLMEAENRVVGFFPFHRRWGGVARPVGLGLSDYHGVIAEPEADWTAEGLMRGCRLVRWEFDHLLSGQAQWQTYRQNLEPSPTIDTSQKYEHYEAIRRKLGGKQLYETNRRIRKLAREHEPHRFVFHTDDAAAFEAMIAWKRLQCQRTGVHDYFGLGWTVELVRRINAHDSIHFGGVLSALYVGDKLAAVHFGMRTKTVLHSWFPGYDDEFHQYSPGLILLVEMIRHACDGDISYIDLGKDVLPYKEKFMTGAIQVAEGCAELPSAVNNLYALRRRAERWSRQSALLPILRIPGRFIKRLERKGRYE